MKRAMALCVALAGVGLVISLAVWGRVPDPMPVHWNWRGEPDGWAPRWFGLLLMPAVIVGQSVLVAGLLRLDPRRQHVERSEQVVAAILPAFAALMLAMHVLMIKAALSADQHLSGNLVVGMIGVLFIVMGNVMPKTKSNWFVGVRTPWTLSSERTWHLTHRFAGWCMVVAGIVALLASLLPDGPMAVISLSAFLLAGLLPVVYSYLIHRPEPVGEDAADDAVDSA